MVLKGRRDAVAIPANEYWPQFIHDRFCVEKRSANSWTAVAYEFPTRPEWRIPGAALSGWRDGLLRLFPDLSNPSLRYFLRVSSSANSNNSGQQRRACEAARASGQ